MQENILDGKAKGQEIACGYTKEVNNSAKPQTGKKLSERQKEVEVGKQGRKLANFTLKFSKAPTCF